jgi:ABC-type sugar transport system ATPase subunit
MTELAVELDRVNKQFTDAEQAALRDVTIAVTRGEFLVVVGPSGCGKSTTLRLIAGLEDVDSGSIRVAGKEMKNVAPQDRDVAMVFQGYALYPEMTVRENLEFPLKMRDVPPEERSKRVADAAKMLRLEKLLARRPAELSGGERQRVAMGRAIVRKPTVFLFDEPLSNLDAALRADLRVEIGTLVRNLGATAIYVTHDQVEAMTLADRICVMRSGRVEQIATPREAYEKPATSFVATFLGSPKMNLISSDANPFRVATGAKTIGIRPEDIRIVEGGVKAEIVAIEPLGAETHLLARAGDIELRIRSHGFETHSRGQTIGLELAEERIHAFDEDGKRIA